MTASAAARTISRHYNAPPLNYIQAPSMIISRINSTNTIAALDPVPHPQLPIIHSSFFSIHNILWKNKKSVLYFINNKKSHFQLNWIVLKNLPAKNRKYVKVFLLTRSSLNTFFYPYYKTSLWNQINANRLNWFKVFQHFFSY